MSKTQARSRQLELPVLVSLNGAKATAPSFTASSASQVGCANTKIPMQASAGDQAIYRAISENYFRNLD